MGYITKYGSFWGLLPQTAGRIFWVADAASYTVEGRTYTASDANDGLSPERAFLTVDYAVGQTTANEGDVIVLLHGSHSVSATIAVDVAGITITGLPGATPIPGSRSTSRGPNRRSSITSTQTAGIIFTVSADDVEIAHLDLQPPAAGGRGISVNTAADRLYVHDCSIIMDATASTTTYGITWPADVTGVSADARINNCYFQSGLSGASGANGPAVNVLGTVRGMVVENSTFELKGTAAWADAILASVDTSEMTIRDCDFITPKAAGTVMTDAIDVTGLADGAGSVKVFRCYFTEGSDAFEATATLDITAAENYLSTATGGALTGSV